MAFNTIFWGLLFFFDFRVGGFDLLPNVIGYLLIFNGLCTLVGENEHFALARNSTIPLIIFSLFTIYQVPQALNQAGSMGIFSILVGIISSILNIYLVYHLCMGIADKAKLINSTDLEIVATNRWRYFLIYQISILVFWFLGIVGAALLMIFFIPLFIFSIVIIVLLMGLMKQAEAEFYNND